jgi:ABC-type protease/lipase transport system fused ATPase/permease subunit
VAASNHSCRLLIGQVQSVRDLNAVAQRFAPGRGLTVILASEPRKCRIGLVIVALMHKKLFLAITFAAVMVLATVVLPNKLLSGDAQVGVADSTFREGPPSVRQIDLVPQEKVVSTCRDRSSI